MENLDTPRKPRPPMSAEDEERFQTILRRMKQGTFIGPSEIDDNGRNTADRDRDERNSLLWHPAEEGIKSDDASES